MKDSKIKIFLMSIVSLLVITILFSNMGQNFKTNISSYDNTLKYFKALNYYSGKSKYYQGYINSSSRYITKLLSINNFEPLINKNYIDQWSTNIPSKEYNSSLEVFDKNNVRIKKYVHGTDFIEDYRGNIVSGTVKSKALYSPDLNSIHTVLTEILLFDGYKTSNTLDSITSTDSKLKSLGASGIISPFTTNNPLYESGYFSTDLNISKKGKGIAKFLVNPAVFNELKEYMKDGYFIKIKSGGKVNPIVYKNVYGVMPGKNKAFKPLVVCVFYDGLFKTINKKFSMSKKYSLPSSLILDCIRVVNKQRLRKPDRTIVFAFLSGYSQDKVGLTHFINNFSDGNNIILDGIGLNNNFTINYSKSNSGLSTSISYFLKNVGFNVVSRIKNNSNNSNVIVAPNINIDLIKEITSPDVNRTDKSSKFILSLIQDECYNLDFVSGNISQFRTMERFIRNNSAGLSLIAFIFLIIIVFFPIKKNKND